MVPAASAQQPGQPVRAFRPVVSVGIFGFGASAGVQVEQRLGRHFSLGLRGERYFSGAFPGYHAALLGRYYFRPAAPAGLFLQAYAGAYSTQETLISSYPGQTSRATHKFGGQGGGLGLGYQWFFNAHLALAAGLGVQVHPHSLNYCDCYGEADWYAVGQPGSVLDGQLSVGYAF